MVDKITPSFLFAKNKIQGDCKCFFCGVDCSNEFLVEKIVKKTFTNRNLVACPSSEYVCANCVATLNENIDVQLCTGEKRSHQRVRTYSWVLTESDSIAYTKAHIPELRNICLNPPAPPFVMVLADSGKKHLVFRSRVNFDRNIFRVTLEEDLIKVDVVKLKNYIDCCIPIIASVGKVVAKDYENEMVKISIQLEKLNIDLCEEVIEKFLQCDDKQLLKLAIWLSPNKEECLELFKP